ncbi:glycosyltransferase [uncultured Alistipes sp.]|uniref:glycosyltransferase family 2 protein n=1 Tax=uncultured Alistipes sp. TaxID=538949 RepID=UPI0025CD9A20|nr:glycosyltransferase [uncultured Alistipes sp.]
MKKISIIIPLYNLEHLIGKCIASTLGQDLPPEEYEVLVIDDGSTDGSLAAAEAASQGHANVRVYTKPNEGLSLTRNYGTDRATGRYVMYLDADDYLEPNVLGRLAAIMEQERLDMLCLEVVAVDEQGRDCILWSNGISAKNGTEVQTGHDFLRRDRFLPMVYTYLYKLEMLNRHKLRMHPIWHEDEEFTPRAIYFARRIQYVPIRVYNYLQRSNSFMGNYNPQSRMDLVRAMKNLHDFAARIEAEDPEGAELLRLHVGKTMIRSCKLTVVRRLGNAREMLRLARQLGIMPLKFRTANFRHFMINRWPGLFILYYRLHKRR